MSSPRAAQQCSVTPLIICFLLQQTWADCSCSMRRWTPSSPAASEASCRTCAGKCQPWATWKQRVRGTSTAAVIMQAQRQMKRPPKKRGAARRQKLPSKPPGASLRNVMISIDAPTPCHHGSVRGSKRHMAPAPHALDFERKPHR